MRSLNEKGTTMIEMLLGLVMIFTVIGILPLGFQVLLNISTSAESLQRLEWEVFSSQIKKEIRMSDSIQVYPEKIILQNQGKVILYEKYGSSIRRRVDFAGHEILLQNVLSIKFEKQLNGVLVKVTDVHHQTFAMVIYSFLKIEVTL